MKIDLQWPMILPIRINQEKKNYRYINGGHLNMFWPLVLEVDSIPSNHVESKISLSQYVKLIQAALYSSH